MNYDDRETSEDDGAPVELFRFILGAQVWLYTSSQKNEVYNGETYIALTLSSPATDQTGESKKTQLSITVGSADDLVSRFRIVPPADTVWLNIFHAHRDDATGEVDPATVVAAWAGLVRGVVMKGAAAEIKCDPLDGVLDRELLRINYQKNCNFSWADSFCGIDRTAYACVATVSGITGNVITLTGSAFTTKPANWFAAGEIFFQGDRREVKAHDSATVSVLLPFEGLTVGAAVVVFPGCDKSLPTCDRKFGNKLRHGGFPNVPGVNVFEVGLPAAVP